jgi:hypothetical protein
LNGKNWYIWVYGNDKKSGGSCGANMEHMEKKMVVLSLISSLISMRSLAHEKIP